MLWNYKFRLLNSDGWAQEEVAMRCEDDLAALDQASAMSAGRSVEIWQEQRLLTRMSANGEAALENLAYGPRRALIEMA